MNLPFYLQCTGFKIEFVPLECQKLSSPQAGGYLQQEQLIAAVLFRLDQQALNLIRSTHDLGIVADVCDYVCVIYAGRIIESATKEDIFDHPTHPYTKGLFAALPDLDKNVRRLSPIEGLPPDPSQVREVCDFYERCPHRCDKCLAYDREMIELSPGHFSRCWRTEE